VKSDRLLAKLRLTEIENPIKPIFDVKDLVLVWQTGIHDRGSIVRTLLQHIPVTAEVDDSSPDIQYQHKYSIFYPNMIVVDHAIRGWESYSYYLQCKRLGCNVILIHLADEAYIDITEIYDCCRLVFRNYWSPLYKKMRDVYFFPLGDNSAAQYQGISFDRMASEREYLWNFLGDATKADRKEAVEIFSKLEPHRLHLVSDFFDPNKLSAEEYRDILSRSKFTICPDGNLNLDTFRFWESIEFGSIPLIVNRGSFRYFELLIKSHLPFPAFNSWLDAKAFVEEINTNNERLDMLQQQMQHWWLQVKANLPREFSDALLNIEQPL
jgi:hypothetical protein